MKYRKSIITDPCSYLGCKVIHIDKQTTNSIYFNSPYRLSVECCHVKYLPGCMKDVE